MGQCFIIQPFDRGKFDKRYEDVFAPAVRAAGIDPYRVDRDPTVTIPIEDIENGIRVSDACLADITENNPNVWFELGFAIAAGKPVIMVCAAEREKFPFDVQHRKIIRYKTESTSDFEELKTAITTRLTAMLQNEQQLSKLASMSSLRESEGLSPHEIAALVSIAEHCLTPEDGIPPHEVRRRMNHAGFNDLAATLATRSLLRKDLIFSTALQDERGDPYDVVKLTALGEQWLIENQGKFILTAPQPPEPQRSRRSREGAF